MSARVSSVAFAAALLSAAAAQAACPPGQPRGACAKANPQVNLDVVPEISQDIVARESLASTPKSPVPAAAPAQFYSGPMVDVTTNKARRTPTIGYHWSID